MESDSDQKKEKTKHSTRRRKKRKSRSERDKMKAHHQNKKELKQSADPTLKPEFRRHLNRAQDVSMQLRVDEEEASKHVVSAITHNRLTRGLGMYGKGKKSETILRALSKKSHQHVANDMKKILDLSQAGLNNVASLDLLNNEPGNQDHEVNMEWQETGQELQPLRSSTKVTPVQNKIRDPPSCPDMDAVMEIETKELSQEMPLDIPMEDIANRLKSHVDIGSVFPGRDYLAEVREKIKKTLKHSMMGTPPSVISLKSSHGSSSNQSSKQENASTASTIECDVTLSSKKIPSVEHAVNETSSKQISKEYKSHSSDTDVIKSTCVNAFESRNHNGHNSHRMSSRKHNGQNMINYNGDVNHTYQMYSTINNGILKRNKSVDVLNEMDTIWPSAAEIEHRQSAEIFISKQDLLDDLEQGLSLSSSRDYHHLRHPLTIQRIEGNETDDSSPMYYASVVPLPERPADTTPSPPDKLFPMRMF